MAGLVWHYQTTPGDNWDYTATQHIMLADLEIAGQMRAVLMQAPKNGFFYVLDRATGELLSAEKYAEATWATHVDMETGRPQESASSNYDESARIVRPSPGGAHNWEPMAFSQETGLVYIPARDSASVYSLDDEFAYQAGDWNTGLRYRGADYEALREQRPDHVQYLVAWDPRTARGSLASTPAGWGEWWRAPGDERRARLSREITPVDSAAYAAADGQRLWKSRNFGGNHGAASELSGGWHAVPGPGCRRGRPARIALAHLETLGRVFVFKLGGQTEFPAVPRRKPADLNPPPVFGNEAQIAAGEALYGRHCGRCHGRGTEAQPWRGAGSALRQRRGACHLARHRGWRRTVDAKACLHLLTF